MSAVAIKPRIWTTEELLALPEDGTERWLIRGRLWEKPMTKRNRFHSTVEGEIGGFLWAWLRTQPRPRGRVVSGEAGFILRRNPDTTVGIDVAVISPAMAAANPPDTTLFDGPPILAVEILSPNDVQRETDAKIQDYLACSVLVWVVSPELRTVTVYRPSAPHAIFGDKQILTGDPELPGFTAPVADLFL